MNLNLATWQEFQLDHLFTIKKGKRLTSEEQEDGSNNYIGAIDSNNGVANHIAQPPIASVYKGILHKTTKNGLPTY